MIDPPHVLLAGVGSPHGDDQVGWRIAEQLQKRLATVPDIAVRKAAVPTDLIDWLENVRTLHVVDACLSHAPTGSVVVLVADRRASARGSIGRLLRRLKQLGSRSSHDFGLAATLQLAARLDRLPDRVAIHAIAARQFEPASRMSDDLTRRLPDITESLFQELIDARSLARAVAAESG